MNVEDKKGERAGRIKWLVLILLFIILLLELVISGSLIWRQVHEKSREHVPGSVEKVSGGVELVVDPDAENSLPHKGNHNSEQGVVIAGQESIIFSSDTKEETVNFTNPKENADLYYLTFELRLYVNNRTDYEVLYTSGLVEPGKSIRRITLSHELKKGIYDAVVHVQPYCMNEERTLTNNADLKIKLIVQ